MLRPKIDLVTAALFAILAIPVAAGGAIAKPIQQGTGSFDCSCSGGKGTCSYSTSGPTMSCSKKSGDTCTGSCKMTITPTAGGAAAIKSGKTGGMKAAH